MSGLQFAAFTWPQPRAMKATTTVSFTATMMLLKSADSFVPRISRIVISATIRTAGRFSSAVPPPSIGVPGALANCAGITMPTLFRMLVT